MKSNDYCIRLEREEDYRNVENLIREAFWNVYRPGCIEHYLIHCLRDDPNFVRELDFVLEKDHSIIGQIIFYKTTIELDDGEEKPIMIIGPICIDPNFQGHGYGKKLLDEALEKAKQFGVGAVCLEGNIDFYGKSGFTYASNYHLTYEGLPEAPFFLCKELLPGYLTGISGSYKTPQSYMVEEGEADLFDQQFPPKQKLRHSGQLF